MRHTITNEGAKSGKIVQTKKFLTHRQNGKYQTLYNNGKVWIESFIVDGQRHGNETRYYRTGQIYSISVYDSGVMKTREVYSKNGTLKSKQ